ncbi:hypothetical protein T1E_2184 [Pseudomonas putida DOT-T1E]|uniref:Uncharacterized protein n=1 Tax=Pseudomonas putida (strain DOT-T1E) TaxID=1196325 RepID=I7BV32_PSEPT|nr:hypothetical protein T1E_2184 [Pseudomonas putida DOT-T1E]
MALCPHFIGSALEQLNLRLDERTSGRHASLVGAGLPANTVVPATVNG